MELDSEKEVDDVVEASEMRRVWKACAGDGNWEGNALAAEGKSSGVRRSVSEEASDMATSVSVEGNWKRLGRFALYRGQTSLANDGRAGQYELTEYETSSSNSMDNFLFIDMARNEYGRVCRAKARTSRKWEVG